MSGMFFSFDRKSTGISEDLFAEARHAPALQRRFSQSRCARVTREL